MPWCLTMGEEAQIHIPSYARIQIIGEHNWENLVDTE